MPNVTRVSTWRPLTNHVQQDIPDSGKFIDAKTVLLAAGPARFSDARPGGSGNLDFAYPIGAMENFSLSQSRTVQRIFEIGSLKSYFVPGRSIGQVSFGRSLYNGDSLLKVLNKEKVIQNGATVDKGFRRPPGSPESLLYIDLASDFFNVPFGLLAIFIDNNGAPYGAFYLQECHLQGHQISVNSQSTVIVEGASAQFDSVEPVELPTSALSNA